MAKSKPVPQPTDVTAAFWAGAAERRFLLQHDPAGGRPQFFPRPVSPSAGNDAAVLREASGLGTLVAATLCRVPAPGFENDAPYWLGLVQLAEGPRVFTPLVNCPAAGLEIGAKMRIVWGEPQGDGRGFGFEPIYDSE